MSAWDDYKYVMEDWRKWLDNSELVETFILEIGSLPSFRALMEDVVDNAYHCDPDGYVFDLISDVWDIAYSHGRHDAMADEGLTLDEIVESGE